MDDTPPECTGGLGMATPDQRHALLAVICPWCHAARGEFCSRPDGRRQYDQEDGLRRDHRAPISTLDGGCHDARWVAAGLGSAPVLTEAVAALRAVVVAPSREPVPAMAGAPASGGGDRPW